MSINNHNKAYRRGVVLGLTLAEVMLLLLFILLLAFMSILKKEHQKELLEKKELELVSKKDPVTEKVIYLIKTADPSIRDELVKGIENLPDNLKLIKKENLAKTLNESLPQVISRGLDELKREKYSVIDIKKPTDVEKELEEAKDSESKLESQIENLKGQNKFLSKQIISTGKGDGRLSCWVDNSSGKAEYIYNIYLNHQGITIKDNKIPHRQEDQKTLPISMITYDEPLEINKFMEETNGIHQWAINHDCIFYVRLFDDTGTNEKTLYKSQLRTVESSFYKYLM